MNRTSNNSVTRKKWTAVRKSMYYKIFVTDFTPQKATFARNSEWRNKLTGGIKYEFDVHQTSKLNMREVRNEKKKNKELPVLLFDLQNVIPTLHVNISFLFYLRKLNAYNLNAYHTPTRQVFCALWSEKLYDHARNDIASAFHKIPTILMEENDITELITWSDSYIFSRIILK
ncbi:hypothetical protein AVEN_93400-1 [Araneus ventricosus]|uniref:Uncharacterized protein n=1 Tax=Araneus ventricosus TaxID=182803 RepID=A0A4Y2ANX9_ARAVE|nr:hypothetical protein AVEN_93400-1 [Araneus ventricosus]